MELHTYSYINRYPNNINSLGGPIKIQMYMKEPIRNSAAYKVTAIKSFMLIDIILFLKGQCHEIFNPRFLKIKLSPLGLIHGLKLFPKGFKIR
jgi:hypothetical protein